MLRVSRAVFPLIGAGLIATLSLTASAQPQYPKPTDLPNPYRLVEGWPTLPKNMNGGRWGEVIRVNVRVTAISGLSSLFQHCAAHSAVCINRGPDNPPILSSILRPAVESFGAGLFAYPHGFTVDREGTYGPPTSMTLRWCWYTARNATGGDGQEVLALPNGQC
jgi:hypothetical protein